MKQKKEEAKNGLYVYQPGKKSLYYNYTTVLNSSPNFGKKYKNFSFDINGVPQKFTAII